MEKTIHKVNVAGAAFKIVSDDTPEYVNSIAKELDLKIDGLLKNGTLSITQAAIISALEYADLSKKSDSSIDEIREQLKESLKDVAAAKKECEFYKRELERLQGTKLEEAEKNPSLW